MLARHYLKEVLVLIRSLGLPTIIVLTFLYLVAIGSLAILVVLKSSITRLASNTEIEVFFKPEIGIDEVQFTANHIQSNPLISEVTIRPPDFFLESFANPLDGSLEMSELIKDLSSSINLKINTANSSEIQSFISSLRENPYIDEIIYNLNGHQTLVALANVLNKSSIGILILTIIISVIISLLITNLITVKNSSEIQVLKSLGASPTFIALPMILFLFIIQPFSYFLAVLIYKMIAHQISHLVDRVEWLYSITKTKTHLNLYDLFKFWILSLGIFISIGTLKILRVSRYGHMVAILFLFQAMAIPSWAMKETTLTNLNFKTQAITNELFLIESHLIKIQNRIDNLKAENKTLQKTMSALAHYYRKSKIKLNHVWLSDSAQLSQIKSRAKFAESLLNLINLQRSQLKNNKLKLVAYYKDLKKRRARLEKLHTNLALTLNLKKAEYDSYRNLIAQQVRDLKKAFNEHDLMTSGTVYSPIFGKVVFLYDDQLLGKVLIIEKSASTHLIFFELQQSNLKPGDWLKPGDIIAVNPTKIPKLQIRILNQNIPIHQLIAKGS